jgi:hypothetical protein
MLTIREEQIRILAKEGLRCWLHDYLNRNYPAQVERSGAETMGVRLNELIAMADRRGFRTAEDVRRYVHVGFLLGPEFETRYAWAGAVLEDPELDDPGWRAKSLEEAAIQFLCSHRGNRVSTKEHGA